MTLTAESVLRERSSYIADQILAWGEGNPDESDDDVAPSQRGTQGRAAGSGSVPAPPVEATAAPMLSAELGIVVGFLDCSGAHLEAKRMIEDASSVSSVGMIAFSFDRREIADAPLSAGRVGASVPGP